MKKLLLIISELLIAYGQDGFNLTVKINNLRNSTGNIQYSVYNKADSLPDQKFEKYYIQAKANIVNNSSQIVFRNLSKGRYAINILHDENKDGQINKGFIMPIEGIGLSNYKTINLFNRPNFKNASFILDKNKEINIIINYLGL